MTNSNTPKRPARSDSAKGSTSAKTKPAKIAVSKKRTRTTPKQPPSEGIFAPAVPIREGVLFPGTESVLSFGRPSSIAAIKFAIKTQQMIVLVTQKDPNKEDPSPTDFHTIGTLAAVEKALNTDGTVNALVRGVARVYVLNYEKTTPFMRVEAVVIDDTPVERDEELVALVSHLQKEFRKAVHMGKPVEFLNFMKLMGGVTDSELVDQIASTLQLETTQKQLLLEELDVKKRMKVVIEHLAHEMKVLEIEKDVVHKTQQKFDKHMRENVLRERLRTIKKELGELDEGDELADEFTEQLRKKKLPKHVIAKVKKEINRLKQMSPNNPEAGYVRTWLEIVFDLPWQSKAQTPIDLASAEKVLDESHFGLDKVKDRVLEYVAVLQLKQQNVVRATIPASKQPPESRSHKQMPTILCFVGPPGVGKTSIGKSIAAALGRKFAKISLGGVRDEAEIRGHRRTYVGALPGKIISSLRTVGVNNPVFMLDEIDKLSSDYRGDPSSALLEALDPEQNHSFEDHYLDLPYDLSEVIFITTANTLDTIPPALKDRLEVIRYAGYTQSEKFVIAKNHLWEKVLDCNAVKASILSISDSALKTIIARYTREAGVRNLERELSKIARKAAREMVTRSQQSRKKVGTLIKQAKTKRQRTIHVTPGILAQYLGPAPFDATQTELSNHVGLASGLAYTSVGGELLFIEVALTPGKGNVSLTGKLGDVMKESAQAALTYVKSASAELGIDPELLQKSAVHIHVPEGSVPKDGPSAGITIATAIVSACTKIPVKNSVAMTGEITLRGRVMRIGGLKEKSLAALQAGIDTIIIPTDNMRDVPELPKEVKKACTIRPVKHISEVLEIALERSPFQPTA